MNTQTVPTLDLARYLGKWYEIARFDHKFERNMVGNMADYSLQKNGMIKVVNSAWLYNLQGQYKTAIGKAKQVDPAEPGKLKVAFFLWFYADYYIFELGENYEYAVVGSSSPNYLWILSRTKTMDQSILDGILGRLGKRGYEVSKFIFVTQ
ncbi:MAG: lipocalin family protein [Bacteroidales bacterium]